jgi:hypothetical protein
MKTVLLYIFLFACLPLTAQTSLTVTYTSGKVFYYPPQQSSAKTIYPGLTLSSGGRVRCDKGAKVKLLCKGKTFELKDTKTYALSEIAKEAGSTTSLSFIGRFWGFLSGSMESTEDQKHLEEHHKKSMENLRAGIKGYASQDFAIQADLLYCGKLSDKEVNFTWTPTAGLNSCFRLTNQADDAVILTSWTKANTLRLNLSDLALEDGSVYEWQIITKEGDAAAPHSRKMQFVYHPDAANKALAETRQQSAYETASPVEQQLMEMFALETNEFYYEVKNRYQKLSSEMPEDMLVKRAHAAFLARIDKLEEAKTLLN